MYVCCVLLPLYFTSIHFTDRMNELEPSETKERDALRKIKRMRGRKMEASERRDERTKSAKNKRPTMFKIFV